MQRFRELIFKISAPIWRHECKQQIWYDNTSKEIILYAIRTHCIIGPVKMKIILSNFSVLWSRTFLPISICTEYKSWLQILEKTVFSCILGMYRLPIIQTIWYIRQTFLTGPNSTNNKYLSIILLSLILKSQNNVYNHT